jgi:peptidoglycan/xylan/chitin deacetylase (PgdA/CDA1 family)
MNQKYSGPLTLPVEGNPEKIKVLLYHLVTNDQNFVNKYPKLCVHVDEFRYHLKLLERWGYTAITFEDYRLFLEGELDLPKKPIIITFDDGFSETFKLTLPLLQEYGVKAVYFVLGDRKIKTSVWDTYVCGTTIPLMNDEQILELHEAGFEIGSHSMAHGNLPSLNREQAWEEISRSRMSLEILLNAPVRNFAYPYGMLNQTIKEMVKDAGYTFGCATYTGPPQFGSDKYEFRRILIPAKINIIGFALRVRIPYQYYAFAIWKSRKALLSKTTLVNSADSVEADGRKDKIRKMEKEK